MEAVRPAGLHRRMDFTAPNPSGTTMRRLPILVFFRPSHTPEFRLTSVLQTAALMQTARSS
jgi:hypothetical protein